MKRELTTQLEEIIRKTERTGGGHYSKSEIDQLSHYYRLVLKWNRRLHLTTITQPREFVLRHLRESELAAARLLKFIDQVWDLGSGLGIPGIPIAILRPDLDVYLVEANRAKAIFLEEVVAALRLVRVEVVHGRFEMLDPLPETSCLMARAVEKMGQLVPEMLRVGERCSQMILFGTRQIQSLIEQSLEERWKLSSHSIPESEQRLLIELNSSTWNDSRLNQ